MDIVADAEQAKSTGGMVALIPSDESIQNLAVRGGEPPQDLHTTLMYFGEEVNPQVPDLLLTIVQHIAESIPQGVTANAFAHASFNPQSDQPCVVYLVGNAAELNDCYEALRTSCDEVGIETPEQHTPWIPHITAGYGIPIQSLTYGGEVYFDKISVHWYGEVYDFYFGQKPVEGHEEVDGIGLVL